MDMKRYAEAIEFAAIAHDGAYRKGTKIPYITHVVEAGLIAMTMTDDDNTIIAAILHDVVEDTSYELADIESRFGSEVAELVSYESEDKMRDIPAADSWKMRKEAFLAHLESVPLKAKIICLSDKLSNMRRSAITYLEKGDDMWLDFNQKDKNEQEWYYRSICEKIPELADTDAYKEYVKCCDEVFGRK
jgi:myo-inositol-1(or 4)-monophosphatase